jgi:hypothetical protein
VTMMAKLSIYLCSDKQSQSHQRYNKKRSLKAEKEDREVKELEDQS